MRAYRPLPKDAVLTLVRRAAIAALAPPPPSIVKAARDDGVSTQVYEDAIDQRVQRMERALERIAALTHARLFDGETLLLVPEFWREWRGGYHEEV